MSGLRAPNISETDQEFASLILGDIGEFGDANALYEGEAISVFGGIPGEEVVARIVRYRRRGKRNVSGIVTQVLKPSPHRVAPPCPYFGPCTGCQWQHIAYPYQLRLKQQAVEAQLGCYSDLEAVTVSPSVASPKRFNYRNHARFTVRAHGALGFINRITRRFVRVEECMLMHPWINHALRMLQGNGQETTQLSIRYGVNTGDWLIQPVLHSPDVPLTSGQTHYGEKLLGQPFRIASPSFFQVNTEQAERLAELVRSRLRLSGNELLVDAYAGVGTFAVLFAPFARRVIAIEESAAAFRDAAVNTAGIENLTFVEGKTEEVLDRMDEAPDVVILDPPRVGCHPHTLQAVIRRSPRRLVYVSCEPSTLARDLHLLTQGGFRVVAVEPIDMFPHTYHVECVATLEYEG